jgi:hypothetical protein
MKAIVKNTVCWNCGYIHDRVSHMFGDKRPKDGDITLCIGCGEWSLFEAAAAGGLRKPTDTEFQEIANNLDCTRLREAWALTRRSQGDGADVKWTTRLEGSQEFGVDELHSAWFQPDGWPGKGTVISLGIPECEAIYTRADGSMLVHNPTNRNVRACIRATCRQATKAHAVVLLHCDTLEQLEHAVRLATKLLPHHRRAALERFYDPKWRSNLN